MLLLLLLFAAVPPVTGAGPHLEPGTLVADGSHEQAVLVLLYVQGGYGDAQSVYVVRPVGRCRDPGGPGWFAVPPARAIRSAAVLEGGELLGTLDPATLPAGCANPVPSPLPPAAGTAWDRLIDGMLDPFGPVIFPSFAPPSPAGSLGGVTPDDGGGSRLVEESPRRFATGA